MCLWVTDVVWLIPCTCSGSKAATAVPGSGCGQITGQRVLDFAVPEVSVHQKHRSPASKSAALNTLVNRPRPDQEFVKWVAGRDTVHECQEQENHALMCSHRQSPPSGVEV